MSAKKHRLEPILIGSLQAVGPGIMRPETTLGTRSAQIYSSTDDAAVAIVNAAGEVSRVGKSVCSNGIAMDLQGRILIANFSLGSDRPGPLQRLDLATGEVEDLVTEIDGRRLVASNFVVVARDGTIYCTHSSWGPTSDSCVKPHIEDGFVYRVTADGAVSVVATGLAGANGCSLDAEERYLYVAQTGRGQIVRFARNPDGTLGPAEPYGPQLGDIPLVESADDLFALPPAQKARLGHPDNIAFDADGNLWVALVVANKIVAITPEGELVTVIDDPACTTMVAPTSIAWGGPDLMDVYIGSLGLPHVLKARSPVPGMPLCHQA